MPNFALQEKCELCTQDIVGHFALTTGPMAEWFLAFQSPSTKHCCLSTAKRRMDDWSPCHVVGREVKSAVQWADTALCPCPLSCCHRNYWAWFPLTTVNLPSKTLKSQITLVKNQRKCFLLACQFVLVRFSFSLLEFKKKKSELKSHNSISDCLWLWRGFTEV